MPVSKVFSGSVILGSQGLVMGVDRGTFRGNHHELVDQPCNASPDERAKPVDPVVPPPPAHQCRPKCQGWIHGGSLKGPSNKDICPEDEPDCKGCYDTETASLGVDRCRIDRVNQPEGHHYLKEQCPHLVFSRCQGKPTSPLSNYGPELSMNESKLKMIHHLG